MTKWLRRVRGALLMGVIWAVLWMPVGLLIGALVDPDGAMDEPWVLVGTYPGFLAGVLFSVVLGIAARRRKLDDLSVAKVARWGAAAGVLIGSLPFVLGDASGSAKPLWWLPVAVVGSITVLSTVSATASLVLAKRSERMELTAGGEDIADLPVRQAETIDLPGARR